MDKKQWTGLLMVYISYLLLGATIFYFIEAAAEDTVREHQYQDYANITRDIKAKFGTEAEQFAARLEDYCGKTFEFEKDIDEVVPTLWNFYSSFFFVVTVVSTIGYGNLHPTTDLGRVLMVVYAIIGIPLNGILLSSLGQFFAAVFYRAHQKYKSHGQYDARCTLAVNILTYLTPGLIIFIFLPAGLFCYFENWDYIESVYFAFVTLTTIGFGDLVAGQQDTSDAGWGLWSYKVLLVCWVIFGLGYLVMLLGFVAQAMQNKKILRLEEKLLASLTHSKIWHGFAKDIGYLRRLMNELYLDKLKPVFREEKGPSPQIMHRSKSLPNLFGEIIADEEAMRQQRWRARAMSEYAPKRTTLTRVFSDTDLQRIDRQATFAAASSAPTTFELMRRVIDVYAAGQMRPWPSEEEDAIQGVEGFTDAEITASEAWFDHDCTITTPPSKQPSSIFNVPNYQDTVSRQPHRGRAMSECPKPQLKQDPTTRNSCVDTTEPADWTWSGPNANKLHDIIKRRNKQRMQMGLSGGRKPSMTASLLAGAKRMNPLRHRRRRYFTETDTQANNGGINNGISSTLSVSVPEDIRRTRHSLQESSTLPETNPDAHYKTTTAAMGRNDFTNDLHNLYSRGDHLFSNDVNRKEILDETSLADFLRVLTSLHARVGERLVTADTPPKPRRKMGTASLTPPRIRSLLELFPAPITPVTPRLTKKRKTSKTYPIESRPSESVLLSGVEGNKQDFPEPSKIKRLGRFLLRSYSTTPRDVEASPRPTFRRKRFSLWPADGEDGDIPPFQLQVDSPSGGSKVSIEIETDEPRKISEAGLLFPPVFNTPPSRNITSNLVDPQSPKSRSRKSSNTSQWVFLDDSLSDNKGDVRK